MTQRGTVRCSRRAYRLSLGCSAVGEPRPTPVQPFAGRRDSRVGIERPRLLWPERRRSPACPSRPRVPDQRHWILRRHVAPPSNPAGHEQWPRARARVLEVSAVDPRQSRSPDDHGLARGVSPDTQRSGLSPEAPIGAQRQTMSQRECIEKSQGRVMRSHAVISSRSRIGTRTRARFARPRARPRPRTAGPSDGQPDINRS